ncbi:UNVERIFIED_CONTAM: membrane protease YdiL (CAAX protease family) [Brevibacillus sp. OAP136]
MHRTHLLRLAISYGILGTSAVWVGLVWLQSLMATFILFHFLVCCMIPIVHGIGEGSLRARWSEAFAIWFTRTEGIFVGIATGTVLCLAALSGLYLLLQVVPDKEQIRPILIRWGLSADWLGLFFTYIVFVNSLLEELMWRGFLLERLERVVAPMTAMLLSSFFYALYHVVIGTVLFGWKWGAVITGAVFCVGMMWAYMKRRHPPIYAVWISHLLADLGIMLALSWWIF